LTSRRRQDSIKGRPGHHPLLVINKIDLATGGDNLAATLSPELADLIVLDRV
jgi:hypothetical protein